MMPMQRSNSTECVPDEKAPAISVVIVNFNGGRFLSACLASLHEHLSHRRYEIVVVDNQSTDGSREWLAARDDIVFVPAPTNLGFTGGNNLGAEQARGRVLLFINNDTIVRSTLDPMLDALDDTLVGLVGCRLVYGDGRQQFSFGYEHTPLRLVLSWLGAEKRSWLPSVFRRLETNAHSYAMRHAAVDWVSGACFAMRAEDWRALGGFDTRFFMYCEDVDLCKRVR